MKQVTDLSAIERVVDEIIATLDKVEQVKASRARGLVRRSGDESVRRQGQSESRERSAQGQARPLTIEDGRTARERTAAKFLAR